jgi:hypothetical protein
MPYAFATTRSKVTTSEYQIGRKSSPAILEVVSQSNLGHSPGRPESSHQRSDICHRV